VSRRTRATAGPQIERLIGLLARMPGLGPRSARRAALTLLKKRDALLRPLASAMSEAADAARDCQICGNLDVTDPCGVCADADRDATSVCVVAEVGDLWALERSGAHGGRYHVLGGTLSALDGVRPEDLRVGGLIARIPREGVEEVILALSATVEGQTTAHFLAETLADAFPDRPLRITRLSHGVPVGGELDHLDDGTLAAALKSRR
jgi:recombination protein RecR